MTQRERCHQLIARLYEKPSGDLTVEDVDLIKRALKRLADDDDNPRLDFKG